MAELKTNMKMKKMSDMTIVYTNPATKKPQPNWKPSVKVRFDLSI
jgi:hypothetical protein